MRSGSSTFSKINYDWYMTQKTFFHSKDAVTLIAESLDQAREAEKAASLERQKLETIALQMVERARKAADFAEQMAQSACSSTKTPKSVRFNQENTDLSNTRTSKKQKTSHTPITIYKKTEEHVRENLQNVSIPPFAYPQESESESEGEEDEPPIDLGADRQAPEWKIIENTSYTLFPNIFSEGDRVVVRCVFSSKKWNDLIGTVIGPNTRGDRVVVEIEDIGQKSLWPGTLRLLPKGEGKGENDDAIAKVLRRENVFCFG